MCCNTVKIPVARIKITREIFFVGPELKAKTCNKWCKIFLNVENRFDLDLDLDFDLDLDLKGYLTSLA